MTLIIAEAGVNHNGDENLAIELINVAHKAGADAVKFQTFNAKSLVTDTAKQAEYQISNTKKVESQLTMLSRLELSHDAHQRLINYCNKLGIQFLSTAFDSESLYFLVHTLQLKTLKIASGEITNAPFILEHARTGCDLILSTGMSTLAEIESALGVIAFGLTTSNDSTPSIEAFTAAYMSPEGQKVLKVKVRLLHCTTEYPAPFNEINLKAMDTLASFFSLQVGYSDHSQGITIPIAAAARGASIIEKHFTLDNEMSGPDHKASLEPDELTAMVTAIRTVEAAMGDGVKTPQVSELKNINVARKSLVTVNPIRKGDIFSTENLAVKRPGTGASPYLYWQRLGTKADKDYAIGEVIFD
ncbi:N-acetylneuraminate synthase [Shewanella nanhaiensis]|uniref:N-acetylneuraminate synthase n=1 Tax=Shewanella nanhaiensis TaxID=2864872 RepID=A0ABS7EBP1_9GAMM|nr:N-acetylneuraminate synthase [Shewanella nanhaiensis]MBW8186492.1 N-acetylneuraminate synthase [Shewanella nanhaiensis]